jgi:L-gulono-1,4-lactone dehydrogenase
MKKILDLNADALKITVESGTTISEINTHLKKYKLALPILPAIPWQSIAGALATSSHGSNTNKGSMSSMIIAMTIVLADGSVRNFSKKDKEFKAIIVNLGCLGVVYSITLKCVPAFTVKHETKMMTLDVFKREMNNLENMKKYVYMQGYIYPELKGNNVKVYYREIVSDVDASKLPIKMKTNDEVKLSPKYKQYKDQKRVDWSDNILTNNQEAGSYTEAEIAVDIKKWNSAVDDVIKLYFEHKKNNNYKSGWPLLVRFTQSDDSLIGMTSGRNSVFIDTFNTSGKAKDKNLENYFKDFENLLIDKYQGRPHYGKRNYLDSKKMKKIYGKNAVEFNKIRKSMDPVGMFSNNYIDNLLEFV